MKKTDELIESQTRIVQEMRRKADIQYARGRELMIRARKLGAVSLAVIVLSIFLGIVLAISL